ncbi:MAG: DNA repair protein RadC [Eubacterium sp.]|nr:DNA repair protein RadC [Eubacterium sp.]MBR7061029.1 DNA repair protein RadC [Eubacterium sp.]
MAELSREKHRERVRSAYLKNSFESMSDSNVLELLLFYAIPRKDVKEIAYALINRFGSLEGVFEADISQLKQVEGVGENTAILINLCRNIDGRISKNRNEKTKTIKSCKEACDFVFNELQNRKNEVVIIICLDNSQRIIKVEEVAQGNSSSSFVEPYRIMECIIKNNAANIIIAHNHPKGSNQPSPQDINFTIDLLALCRKIKVSLNDHIVVGENGALSMADDIRYSMYFD